MGSLHCLATHRSVWVFITALNLFTHSLLTFYKSQELLSFPNSISGQISFHNLLSPPLGDFGGHWFRFSLLGMGSSQSPALSCTLYSFFVISPSESRAVTWPDHSLYSSSYILFLIIGLSPRPAPLLSNFAMKCTVNRSHNGYGLQTLKLCYAVKRP